MCRKNHPRAALTLESPHALGSSRSWGVPDTHKCSARATRSRGYTHTRSLAGTFVLVEEGVGTLPVTYSYYKESKLLPTWGARTHHALTSAGLAPPFGPCPVLSEPCLWFFRGGRAPITRLLLRALPRRSEPRLCLVGGAHPSRTPRAALGPPSSYSEYHVGLHTSADHPREEQTATSN